MSVASYIGRGKFNLDLIKEVQKYDALYNSAHPDFRNYAVKTHIWQEISKALGETEQFCKRRWLDLRKQYSKEQQKTQSVRNTFWIYTDALSFLKPYEKPKIEFLPREISKREAYCRTCLSSFQANPFQAPKTFNIFEIKDFAEKLSQCSSRQVVEWDEYPQVVCELCYKKVIYFYQFREMCLSSLEKFNTIIHDPKEVTYDLENTIEKSFNTTDNDSDLSNILDDSIKTEVEHGKPHSSHEIDDKIMDEIIQVEIERSAGADDVKPVEEFEEEKEISADFEYDTMESEKDFSNFESINEESVEHDPDYVVEELETIDYENPLEENTEEFISKRSAYPNVKKTRNMSGAFFQCEICLRYFRFKHRLDAHIRTHQGLRPYPCTYENCNKAYNRSDELRAHINEHIGVPNIFKCAIETCKEVFNSKNRLIHHRRIAHSGDVTNDACDPLPRYMCEICGLILKKPSLLKKHKYIHMDKSQWPFACDVEGCTRRFRIPDQLKIHKNRHDGIKNYVCPHCDARKTTITELKFHINTHTHERTFSCTYCSKTYRSAAYLACHVRRNHTICEILKCRFCDFQTKTPQNLQKHEVKHTDEKPYSCSECDERFSTIRARSVHMQKNHGKKRKLSVCNECGKTFQNATSLSAHKKLHKEATPYTCKQCGQGFRWPGGYYGHMKRHRTKELTTKPKDESENTLVIS